MIPWSSMGKYPNPTSSRYDSRSHNLSPKRPKRALVAHNEGSAGDDQGDSERPGNAEVRPRTEDTEGVQYEARYQLGRYHEREGPRHAGLPRGHRDGAHYHRPEHARGQRIDDRAARELRPGYEERDRKGAKAGCEAGDRDQDS